MRTMKMIAAFAALAAVAGGIGLAAACGPASPQKATGPSPDPIPDIEYEVFTALFAVQAPGGLNSPQFFEAVPEGRTVSGTTIALKDPKDRIWPVEGFGPVDKALVADYRAKNLKPWPIQGKIKVEYLVVLTPEELDARIKSAAEDPDGYPFGFSGGFVSLSRVGFNKAGDLALLSAAHTSPHAMRAQYLVLMKKTAEGWRLENVIMEDLLYH